MNPVLANATIVFEPDPSWIWQGWNGELDFKPADTSVRVSDVCVALKTDIVALEQKLLGKSNKVRGFEDIPGVVSFARIIVEDSSLSDMASINGIPAAHAGTRGTFSINVTPSLITSISPTPDPVTLKTGKWRVKSPGQTLISST